MDNLKIYENSSNDNVEPEYLNMHRGNAVLNPIALACNLAGVRHPETVGKGAA
jgi:hypothetical protein